MFVEEDADESVVMAITSGWDLTSFFLLVVVVEHIMIILKMFVEQLIDDTPEEVISGKNERAIQLKDFRRMAKGESISVHDERSVSMNISQQEIEQPQSIKGDVEVKISKLGDEPLMVPVKKKISKKTIPVDDPPRDLLPQAKTAHQSLDSKGGLSALSGFKSTISSHMGNAFKSVMQSHKKNKKLEPEEFQERLQRLREKSRSTKKKQQARQSHQSKTAEMASMMFNNMNSDKKTSVSLPKIQRENPRKRDFKLFDALVEDN